MDALSTARGPVLDGSKSILSKSVFRIGEKSDSPEQAIEVPIRYSKATSLARPQSLKKVIASQVARPKILSESITASQSQVPRTSQSNSQIQSAGTSTAAGTSGIAGIEADVSAFTKYYVVQKKNEQDEDVEMGETSEGDRRIEDADGEDEGEYEEMEVDIENCTKAYRFGSTWVPLNEEDFETMPTKSGIEVLGFIKETGV
jgi:ATP-dependent DNA helicase 2 subunit 2